MDRYRCGRLYADCFKAISRYVPERKMWYCYNGKRWINDIGNLKAMELCKNLADDLLVYAATILNGSTIEDEQLVMSEFDKNPCIFNYSNGTLFIDTMEFKAHNKENNAANYRDTTPHDDIMERLLSK